MNAKVLAFLFLAALLELSGCLSTYAKKAKSVLTLPSGALVTQAGAVETPAHVENRSADFSFTIPKDSVFSFEPTLQTVSLKFSRDVPATASNRAESGTAAIPVAPPSLSEIAKAGTLAKFYWLALGLAILSALFFWRVHLKAGFICAAGAIGVPMLGRFYSNEAAQYTALAIVCVAGTLVAGWHLMNAKYKSTIVETIASVDQRVRKEL